MATKISCPALRNDVFSNEAPAPGFCFPIVPTLIGALALTNVASVILTLIE